jgi:mannitol/fructose-specific phosphotransferase system IIA component (Ntr-type)
MKKPSERLRHLGARGQIKQVDFGRLLAPERVLELGSIAKGEALNRLIEAAARSDRVADPEKLRRAVLKREEIASTGIGNGIGVPHAKIPEIRDFVLAVGRSREGIDYGSHDGQPVTIITLIGANDSQSSEFLTVIANLMQKLKAPKFRREVMEAADAKEIYDLFARA